MKNIIKNFQRNSIYSKKPFEYGKQKLKTQPAYL
jgi:hypothetical protein